MALVRREACAVFAAKLGIDKLLVVGPGYEEDVPTVHMVAGTNGIHAQAQSVSLAVCQAWLPPALACCNNGILSEAVYTHINACFHLAPPLKIASRHARSPGARNLLSLSPKGRYEVVTSARLSQLL